jgi:uncharacterized protein with WD repeat
LIGSIVSIQLVATDNKNQTMGHSTTTTSYRPKRPDARPNSKRRRRERQAFVEKAEAKDLQTTRIPKSQHKERDSGRGQVLRTTTKRPASDIRVRALHKLMRQIEVLEEKRNAGEILNSWQQAKVGRLDVVMAELEELLDVDGSTDQDEVGDTNIDADLSGDKEDEEAPLTDLETKRSRSKRKL